MNDYIEISEVYKHGGNISQYLRDKFGLKYNNDKIIELTYDLQSGSYVDALKDEGNRLNKKQYTDEMAGIIQKNCPDIKSLLKGGTGECVTLVGILEALSGSIEYVHGFDMCWSRVAYGNEYLKKNGFRNVSLCTGTLTRPPFIENSFQVVMTSHSMEPNGGREKEILEALYKVTGEWLILFEPSYHHASDQGKSRMDKMGYVKDIPSHAKKLGYNIIAHYPLEFSLNKDNPTAVTIIRKKANVSEKPLYACPITGGNIKEYSDGYFSQLGLCMYPLIGGIPCLKESNGVIASKYPEF